MGGGLLGYQRYVLHRRQTSAEELKLSLQRNSTKVLPISDFTGSPINPFSRTYPEEMIQTGISTIDGG